MKTLISLLVFISVQTSFAEQATETVFPPSATTSMKLETPHSGKRNAIIIGSGLAGAGLGLMAGRSLEDNDNVYNDIAMATLGAFSGFMLGTYFGLKFYPPVMTTKESATGERSTFLNVQIGY